MKGYERDRVVHYEVRFNFEKDRTLRDRVWSLKGTKRKLMFDVRHQKVQLKKD